jgi:uncharacterized RDD family membrane protein YckC
MFCSKCGAAVPEGVSFCPNCGQATGGVTPAAAMPAVRSAPAYPAAAATPRVEYAGFWLRFVAWIIDRIVLQVATGFILFPLFGVSALRTMIRMHPPNNPEDFIPVFASLGRIALAALVLQWLYYALLESSTWQGTLGKKALGLEVTDLSGRRISFGRATGRYFSRIISALTLLIGYIMAGFTQKKQALHDMLAGTLVIKQLS